MREIRLLRAEDIECRVGQTGKSKSGVAWCSLLLYKDARCDMRILDEVFGPFGWQRKHEVINGQLCCMVSVRSDDGEWVYKQDVGVESNTEAVKGSFSDAFKRACFNWGIGRELYTAPKIFITLNNDEWYDKNGKPALNAKTVFTVKEIAYDDNRVINALVIVDRNNTVRYKLGEVQKDEPKSEEQKTFEEQMSAFIKPSLAQANTEEEVKRIWDEYTAYQSNPEFVGIITARLGEIRKVA